MSGSSVFTKFDPLGLKTVSDYDEEIEHHEVELEKHRERRSELKDKGKENWTKDEKKEYGRSGLMMISHSLNKSDAEEARSNIFESAKAIHEKLDVAIDPMRIDDEDEQYQSVSKSLAVLGWIPGSSAAFEANKGNYGKAARNVAIEGIVAYAGGKLFQKAMGPAAGSVDDMATVSRWGRPGLEDGDFVMQGNANAWNWLKSGKWQPGAGNQFAPLKSGQEFVVPRSSIGPPNQASSATFFDRGPFGWMKSAMGQKSYKAPQ